MFTSEASQNQHRCWEKRDTTIFAWQRYAVSLSFFFLTYVCIEARSELKCKTGMKEPEYLWHFIKNDSWYLVPFSCNISCDRP